MAGIKDWIIAVLKLKMLSNIIKRKIRRFKLLLKLIDEKEAQLDDTENK